MDEVLDTDYIPELADPYCNKDNPVIVTPGRILDARDKIKDGVVRTPCTRTRLSDRIGCNVYFKKEFMQFTGSFKDRGALNSLMNLTEEQRKLGVITTSAGNHAQSVAYQGGKLGIPVTVVMPKTTPLVKINSCKDLEANVILHGDRFDEAKFRALTLRNERNLVYIDGFDHPDVLAGQGTAGIEIMEDVPDADYIVVQIGGGGLISGVSVAAKYINPNVKIIGVESERCPGWHTANEHRRPVRCCSTMNGATQSIADGLNVLRVGYNSFATAQIDKLISVPEKYITTAILHLLEGEKSVVEGAGAIGYAALLSDKLPEVKGKKVVCILSGGNIDANILTHVIDRALVQEGRLSRFLVAVTDRPGGLARLTDMLSDLGASIKDIGHDRMSLPSHVYMAAITCTIETRNKGHAKLVREQLEQFYKNDLKWQQFHDDNALH
ncbi:L-threonine ammonia-lyase-like isoform X1 [Styela clava]